MKTVLFIPGFKEDKKSRDYSSTINAIKESGYKVIFVDITWSRTTIIDWVAQLDSVYKQYDPEETILAGFSFGAMTALVSATRQNPSELWLFSLSPYFKEDIESETMQNAWLKRIGKNRTVTFSELHFGKMAKNIVCKTFIFVGQKELDMWPDMKSRTYEARKLIKDSDLSIVAKTGHDVADQEYINTIVEVIK